MNTSIPDDVHWVVVIPAKPLGTAKSRLADAAGSRRPELALAMLLDTVEAALPVDEVAAVLVVTDDDLIAAAASALGAVVVPDLPGGGLNAAFQYGIEVAAARYPGTGVALLAGDLPALRTHELEAALAVAASSPGVVAVADRDELGTTMLAARLPPQLRLAFGVGSFARHRALDAVALELEGLDSLRCDVDDAVGLRAAISLGVGKRTADMTKGWDPLVVGPTSSEGREAKQSKEEVGPKTKGSQPL
ncbi:MAG TPA: 2-phospho-L-lactate guanylyltransferase [Acidothermaceae bacterium]|jgi:2-phospho-L-lactate guanylyltransferase